MKFLFVVVLIVLATFALAALALVVAGAWVLFKRLFFDEEEGVWGNEGAPEENAPQDALGGWRRGDE